VLAYFKELCEDRWTLVINFSLLKASI